MTIMNRLRASDGRTFRRVWIKAFWGFDPENEGFLGFTREGDRTRLFAQHQVSDLILIYGTRGSHTAKDDRGRALGFLEVTPEPTDWRQVISPEAYRWKEETGVLEKWTFAMPVRRAWRVTPGQPLADIEALACTTYDRANVQNIATRGKLLTRAESERALSLRVAETTVFGSGVAPNAAEPLLNDTFTPSRGLVAAPGKRAFEVKDGPCKVYLMRWDGEADHLLADRFGNVRELAVIKIGMSADPARRCAGLNSSLPAASVVRWVVVAESEFFDSIDTAKVVEDRLKAQFAKRYTSLGGEFFLGALQDAGKQFLKLAAC